jgi:transposase-like protein
MKETRTRWTTDEKLALVAAWQASGMAAAKFAKLNGISSGQMLREWSEGKHLQSMGRPIGWTGTYKPRGGASRRNNSELQADTSAAERIAASRARNSAKMRAAMGLTP